MGRIFYFLTSDHILRVTLVLSLLSHGGYTALELTTIALLYASRPLKAPIEQKAWERQDPQTQSRGKK